MVGSDKFEDREESAGFVKKDTVGGYALSLWAM